MMSPFKRRCSAVRIVVAVSIVSLFSFGGNTVLHAQIPDKFTNLQVFPDTISRSRLIEAMRGFSFALGVRCSYCHAVKDAGFDSTDSFASDEKLTKERARVMIRMVTDLNEKYLPKLPEREEPGLAVQCRTCHGGIALPDMLENLLFNVTMDKGIEKALEKYGELHKIYYGKRAYDFSSRSLFLFGEKLVTAGRSSDGIVVFNRILEDEPGSAEAWMNIGAAYVAAGDKQAAIKAYNEVIKLSPDGWGKVAERRIKELKEKK